MSDINGVSVNSTFFAGRTGLQRASDGIEQAASNIAQTTVRSNESLASPSQSINGLSSASEGSGRSVTDDLIALNVNSTSAEASASVLEVANENLGTIIDILA